MRERRELGVGRWEEEEGYWHLFHDCLFRISPVPSAFGKKGPSSCKNPAPTDEHPGPAHSDTAAYNQTTSIIITTDPPIHASSHPQKKNEKAKEFYILNRKHFTDQVPGSCPWAGEVVCFRAAETDLQSWSYCTIQNQTSLSWILVLSLSLCLCLWVSLCRYWALWDRAGVWAAVWGVWSSSSHVCLGLMILLFSLKMVRRCVCVLGTVVSWSSLAVPTLSLLTSIEPECNRKGSNVLVISFHKPVKQRPAMRLTHRHIPRVLLELHACWLSRQTRHQIRHTAATSLSSCCSSSSSTRKNQHSTHVDDHHHPHPHHHHLQQQQKQLIHHCKRSAPTSYIINIAPPIWSTRLEWVTHVYLAAHAAAVKRERERAAATTTATLSLHCKRE